MFLIHDFRFVQLGMPATSIPAPVAHPTRPRCAAGMSVELLGTVTGLNRLSFLIELEFTMYKYSDPRLAVKKQAIVK